MVKRHTRIVLAQEKNILMKMAWLECRQVQVLMSDCDKNRDGVALSVPLTDVEL